MINYPMQLKKVNEHGCHGLSIATAGAFLMANISFGFCIVIQETQPQNVVGKAPI